MALNRGAICFFSHFVFSLLKTEMAKKERFEKEVHDMKEALYVVDMRGIVKSFSGVRALMVWVIQAWCGWALWYRRERFCNATLIEIVLMVLAFVVLMKAKFIWTAILVKSCK